MDIADKYMHTLAADPDLDEQQEGSSDRYKYDAWFPGAAKVNPDKDTASENLLEMELSWPDDPLDRISWPMEMSSSEREVLHTCLDVLFRGGEVVVDRVGIWTREVGYFCDPYGWMLTFSKDETVGITRDSIREFILGCIHDFCEAEACLSGLRFSKERKVFR